MKKSALAVSVLSFRYVTRFSFYKKIIAVMFVVRVRPVYVVSCVGVWGESAGGVGVVIADCFVCILLGRSAILRLHLFQMSLGFSSQFIFFVGGALYHSPFSPTEIELFEPTALARSG